MEVHKITAQRVPEHARMDCLPKHFGAQLIWVVEQSVYNQLADLAPAYSGGYWHYYELSNGGFYMAPDIEPLRVCVAGNGFDGCVSADAAGIIACLFAFSHIACARDSAVLADHYHWLRDFAAEHAEASRILGAID